jgi:hypothetical protein
MKITDAVHYTDDAERLLRRLAPDKGMEVWRGRSDGFLYPKDAVFDCVVVFIPDETAGKPTASLVALATALYGAMAKIETDDSRSLVPFVGGHNPLEDLEDTFRTLPSFAND